MSCCCSSALSCVSRGSFIDEFQFVGTKDPARFMPVRVFLAVRSNGDASFVGDKDNGAELAFVRVGRAYRRGRKERAAFEFAEIFETYAITDFERHGRNGQ